MAKEPSTTISSPPPKQPTAVGFFAPLPDIEQFRQVIEIFCHEQNYHDIKLTNPQLEQLQWSQGNSVISPQATIADINSKIHFDIKRGLSRFYSFELLLRGNEEAYKEFTQAQGNNKLSREIFDLLSKEAQQLNEDIKQAIRATCLLTISDRAKEALDLKCNIKVTEYKNDSELFLTRVSPIFVEIPDLFPLTKMLTVEQRRLLQKAFWPNTHLRHMIFTEGANNMMDSLINGIKQQIFTKQDFQIWRWRWLTNLMGFDAGPGAKYFNQENYMLANLILTELAKLFDEPNTPVLTNYLAHRANLAGFNKSGLNLTLVEQNLLAHLAAYSLKINILNPELSNFIVDGYSRFKALYPDDQNPLAILYENQRNNPQSVTPTYMPAVFSNALDVLRTNLNAKLPSNIHPMALATLFTCQVLRCVYTQPSNLLISGQNVANLKDNNLQNILDEWLKNNMQLYFNIENGVLKVAGFGPERKDNLKPI